MRLDFEIVFHTAYAVDQRREIPGSELKGLMLDAARDLGLRWPVIQAVFGGHAQPGSLTGPTTPSPWAWSDVSFTAELVRRSRSRIRIDPATGTVADGALVSVAEFGGGPGAPVGRFTIERILPLSDAAGGLAEADHVDVLEACARTVTALGGDRRRGLGWVSVCRVNAGPDSPERLTALAARLEPLRDKEEGEK
jgi:hypothetical protein